MHTPRKMRKTSAGSTAGVGAAPLRGLRNRDIPQGRRDQDAGIAGIPGGPVFIKSCGRPLRQRLPDRVTRCSITTPETMRRFSCARSTRHWRTEWETLMVNLTDGTESEEIAQIVGDAGVGAGQSGPGECNFG